LLSEARTFGFNGFFIEWSFLKMSKDITAAQKTMLSTEIAALTEKQHKDVMRDIRVIVEQMQGADLRFACESTTYEGSNGQSYPCFALDYESTMVVLTGYDVVARSKVIKRWQELEQAQTKPLSHLEILAQSALALVEIDARTTALESEVKLLAGKIEKSPADYFTVAGFASLRGIKLGNSDANKGGRIASKLSREYGYPINKAHSEIFGEVNTYHVDILTELFDEHKSD
jgi:phage regulator Rha-like protein